MKTKMMAVMIVGAAWVCCASAQEKTMVYRSAGPADGAMLEKVTHAPVVGAAYSATVINESVQLLADGNRITQKSTGTTARDSQGRTRQDAPLPTIGNMAAANAPHLVFINDPVGQKFFTLNLTEKTAQETGPRPGEGGAPGPADTFFMRMKVPGGEGAPEAQREIALEKALTLERAKISSPGGPVEVKTEDLGSQMMEGVLVTGTRTTKTIPAGHIGNEKPIDIVIEVWTSPELKTVVMSKRSDPRTGEQTFQLKNIVRTEPDAGLFTVPADFKVMEGPQTVIYKTRQ